MQLTALSMHSRVAVPEPREFISIDGKRLAMAKNVDGAPGNHRRLSACLALWKSCRWLWLDTRKICQAYPPPPATSSSLGLVINRNWHPGNDPSRYSRDGLGGYSPCYIRTIGVSGVEKTAWNRNHCCHFTSREIRGTAGRGRVGTETRQNFVYQPTKHGDFPPEQQSSLILITTPVRHSRDRQSQNLAIIPRQELLVKRSRSSDSSLPSRT